MASIVQYFNRLCTSRYLPLGFVKSGKTFVRKVNDVLQVFSFKTSRLGPTCTVVFGVIPLCQPTPVFLEGGAYELDSFILQNSYASGWYYDCNSSESIEACINTIIDTIDLYLIPLFDVCCDCPSSLKALTAMELLHDDIRKQALQISGEQDCARPVHERSLFDSNKLYMALKSHNLPYVQKYLMFQIEEGVAFLEEQRNPNAPRQLASTIEAIRKDVIRHEQELKKIEEEEWDYFDKQLFDNERAMFAYLKEMYPKLIEILGCFS